MEYDRLTTLRKAYTYINNNKDISLQDCITHLKSIKISAGEYLHICVILERCADHDFFKSLKPTAEEYLSWCRAFLKGADYKFFKKLNPNKDQRSRWLRLVSLKRRSERNKQRIRNE